MDEVRTADINTAVEETIGTSQLPIFTKARSILEVKMPHFYCPVAAS